MSWGEVIERSACRIVVGIWLATFLAWQALGANAELRIPIEAAQTQPKPVPHAEPKAPDPPAASKVSEPNRVGAAELATGDELLAGTSFPALSCGYERFGNFSDYAQAMLNLGAQFVAVRQREILGSIDPFRLETTVFSTATRLSPRARDYSGEEELAQVARAARREWGPGVEIMMLVPRQLDAALFGGIAKELSAQGVAANELREVRGQYERAPSGGVWLRVESAVRRDGSPLALDAIFDLSAITHSNTRSVGGKPARSRT